MKLLLRVSSIYDSIYEISSDKKADIVITSAGGYPKDINLYQAQKALESVKDIVKDGGTIILTAECPEGFGEDRFAEWMQGTRDFERLYEKIRKDFVLGGHKAVAVSKLLTRVRVILYSKFDELRNLRIWDLKKLMTFRDLLTKNLNKIKI